MLITLYGGFIVGGFRASEFGVHGWEHLRNLFVMFLFMAPFLLAICLALRILRLINFKQIFMVVLLSLLIPWILIESWCTLEEKHLIDTYGQIPQLEINLNRKFPYENYGIGYDPKSGWYAHD